MRAEANQADGCRAPSLHLVLGLAWKKSLKLLLKTPDERRAFSVSEDGTLRVWDLGTGRVLSVLVAGEKLTCVATDQTGRLIVAGDVFGRVHFLNYIDASQM